MPDDITVAIHVTVGPRFEPLSNLKNIAVVHHEWSRYPAKWVERLDTFDEVWVTSDHTGEVLHASGLRGVAAFVPPALDVDPPDPKTTCGQRGPVSTWPSELIRILFTQRFGVKVARSSSRDAKTYPRGRSRPVKTSGSTNPTAWQKNANRGSGGRSLPCDTTLRSGHTGNGDTVRPEALIVRQRQRTRDGSHESVYSKGQRHAVPVPVQ